MRKRPIRRVGLASWQASLRTIRTNASPTVLLVDDQSELVRPPCRGNPQRPALPKPGQSLPMASPTIFCWARVQASTTARQRSRVGDFSAIGAHTSQMAGIGTRPGLLLTAPAFGTAFMQAAYQ